MAAVYDVSSGQTWTLGTQRPQAEASVVKLDILETLFAQEGDGPTGLPPADQSLAQEMMEDSDNDAATSLWNAVGGPGRIQSFNTAARPDRHRTLLLRGVPGIRLARMGFDHNHSSRPDRAAP